MRKSRNVAKGLQQRRMRASRLLLKGVAQAEVAVFCVDERTHVQALDRKDPVLPLSPSRAECHGFERFRHGAL